MRGAPVDGYEVPDSMREAMALRTPADVFPYANSVSRRTELDHTVPYRPPDEGGPPGQTRPGNLGPMTRRHHRIKTHSAWAVRQIGDGAYLWKSPRGRHYLVDQTGTTAITPIPAGAPTVGRSGCPCIPCGCTGRRLPRRACVADPRPWPAPVVARLFRPVPALTTALASCFVEQIGDGAYLWKSPRCRHYLVDQTGTTAITRTSASPTPAA